MHELGAQVVRHRPADDPSGKLGVNPAEMSDSMNRPMVFSGSPLDRAGTRRRDRTWLNEQLEAEESRFLPFWRLKVLAKTGATRELGWARSDMRENIAPGSEVVLLGLRDGVAHFALDVSSLEKPEAALGLTGAARFEDVRAMATELSGEECAIVAQGRAQIDWHARHRFLRGLRREDDCRAGAVWCASATSATPSTSRAPTPS